MRLSLSGARLEYVAVPIQGEQVYRTITKWDPSNGGLVQEKRLVDPGFMVYFPRGHAIRLNERQMRHYGLDKKPDLAFGMQGLQSSNSLLGQLMMAQDERDRVKAYADLEKQVIRLATAKTGPLLTPEMVKGTVDRHIEPVTIDEDGNTLDTSDDSIQFGEKMNVDDALAEIQPRTRATNAKPRRRTR